MQLPLLLYVLLAFVPFQDSSDSESPLVETRLSNSVLVGQSNSHRFQTDLDSDLFSSVPKLRRSDSELTLSPELAIREATETMDGLVAAKQFRSGFQIDDMRLTPFNIETGDWYWEVSFKICQVGNELERISLAVLLDGTVVPPMATKRFDRGWPPYELRVDQNNGADVEMAQTFIDRLNIDRTFAGRKVTLRGQIKRMPDDHPWLFKTEHNMLFVASDGMEFICNLRPLARYDSNIETWATGRLVGFRNKRNTNESWDGIHLYPGFELQ